MFELCLLLFRELVGVLIGGAAEFWLGSCEDVFVDVEPEGFGSGILWVPFEWRRRREDATEVGFAAQRWCSLPGLIDTEW